jgi:hypothetical protein
VLKTRHILAAAVVGTLVLSAWGCESTNQGYAPTQPIAYSHAVHAGSMQIDCQYCHFSAAKGRHAGIPPAQICMNCHAQVQADHPEVLKVKQAIADNEPIRWKKVHSLPDHVYFNHSAHVNGGVECTTCHGPVAEMGQVEQWAPLTMGWCLDCHRGDPQSESYDRGGPLTDCSVCHH